jgi:hypothetical protein
MTTPDNNKQQWLDFAHTVDVLSASALARSDLAEGGTAAKPRFGGLLKSQGRRVVGGLLAAACLLVVAFPVSRLLDVGVQSIDLQIIQPKASFAAGEPVTFTLQTNKDCHLLLYSIGANDQVTILQAPQSTAPAGDPLLKADTPVQVSPPNAQAPAVAQPSPGNYTIGALCSSESLETLGTSAALLGDAARQGGANFTTYVRGLLNGTNRDQLVEMKVGYDLK